MRKRPRRSELPARIASGNVIMGGISIVVVLLVMLGTVGDRFFDAEAAFARVEFLVGAAAVSVWGLAGIAQLVAGLSLAKLAHSERRRRLRLSVVASGAGVLTALPWALPILGLVVAMWGMISQHDPALLAGLPLALGLLAICTLPFLLVAANIAALKLAMRGGYSEVDAA